jgi:hypothetical protein
MIDNGYRTRFAEDSIPQEVIEATKELSKYIWKDISDDEKTMKITEWLTKAAEAFKMHAPSLLIIKDKAIKAITGGGVTVTFEGDEYPSIILTHYSLMTLLHEFRHCVQECFNMFNKDDVEGREEDARAWSCSLFYLAVPKAFERAMRKEIIYFC